MSVSRLEQQVSFILEIDKLKRELRRTVLTDASRNENSAEHSWHVALMAVLLSEYAAAPVDVDRVVRMMLVHDLVEIDAGDTFCYDEEGHRDKAQREQRAADRIFALLPPEQGTAFRTWWEEFEARETAEAKFAAALDRLQPLLHNLATGGHAWRRHDVHLDQVLKHNRHMAEGAPALWDYAAARIREAVEQGMLAP